jgi:hypothetical protein
MSDVIHFLEKLGTDASLLRAATDDFEGVLEDAGLPATDRAALLGGRTSLEALLGVRAKLCALIHAPEDDEEETEDEPQEDENDEPGPERALGGQRAA